MHIDINFNDVKILVHLVPEGNQGSIVLRDFTVFDENR